MNERRPLESLPRIFKTYHRTTYNRIALQNCGFQGDGKTVLITGGATGIGLSISKAFAKAAVSRIVLVSRTLETLNLAKNDLEATYPKLEVIVKPASVSDAASTSRILREIGQIDIMVLSATAVHEAAPLQDLEVSRINEVFQTNVVGHFALIKHYLESGSSAAKTIINVTSASAGVRFPFNSAYGASKAALLQMIQHFSAEEANKPVGKRTRMYSFHPGMCYTPLISKHVGRDLVDWEDIDLPGDFAVWLAGSQSDFLHGRMVWAQWDVDELLSYRGKIEKDPHFLTIGLVQS